MKHQYRAATRRLLYERPVAVLLVLLLTAMAVIIWHTSRQQSTLVEAQALQNAERLANTLAEFRAIYTSEVVERARQQGITVSHDYKHREGAIPLPATLSIMLGNRIGAHESGKQTRLYSAFPFPWRRADGGLTDDFSEDAWEFLTKKPDTPYFRFEELGGVPVLRYAVADSMRPACVACHNSHPSSPKTDWKVGDVRGVLEVIAPLAVPLAESRAGLVETAALMSLMTLGGLLVLGVVLGHLRRVATEAQDFAKQAQQANTGLEKEIAKHQRAKEALNERTAELEQQSEQLEQALAKEKELNDLQRQFVALVSNEFRTPLAIIDAAAQRIVRLKDRLTPDDIQQRTGDVQSAVKRMTMLIDSTLSAARLDAGAVAMRPATIDLTWAITVVCARQQEIDHTRKISVDVGRITASILADPAMLDQILTNLISNAAKYSPDDSPIEVKGWTKNEHALVSVRDHGLGIPDKDIPRLFERFFRAGTSTGIAGSGIGLHLVKQLVEMHGGSIAVESVEGEGSTFTVRLPIKPAAGSIAPGPATLAAPVAA